MDFLNKHYEKLILLAVLIIFFVGMIFVLDTLKQTSSVTKADLDIQEPKPDFVGTANEEKKISEHWTDAKFNWLRGETRKAYRVQVCYSDLVQFVPLANCPAERCGKLIPLSFFADKNCPECGIFLKTPPNRPKYRRNVITADDSDGDGMPNTFESTFGLDPNDPYDAQYDKDGDGFTNYYEMTCNTDPTVAYNRPALWKRLRLVAVDRVVLPVSFRALNDNNSQNSSEWDVQFNVQTVRNGKVRQTSRTLRIGEELDIEHIKYKLIKVDRKKRAKTKEEMEKEAREAETAKDKKKRNRKSGKDDKFVDESVAYFEELVASDGKTKYILKMTVGKHAYSRDNRPIFVDDGLLPEERDKDVSKISLKIGQQVKLGTNQTGFETYILQSCDTEKKIAVFHRLGKNRKVLDVDAKGEKMIVTGEGSIPDDSRIIPTVVKEVKNNSEF